MNNHIHKYDMGVIGNCLFLAYIDKLANVAWMCLPLFNIPFLFGLLPDKNKRGIFSSAQYHSSSDSNQSYL